LSSPRAASRGTGWTERWTVFAVRLGLFGPWSDQIKKPLSGEKRRGDWKVPVLLNRSGGI
jgi:hypothetical protein